MIAVEMAATAQPGDAGITQLRILTADEDHATLRATGALLERLGHRVVGHAVSAREACEQIARDDPDLSLVVIGGDHEHALDLIEEAAEFARGPIVVLFGEGGAGCIGPAAERGIDAFARADLAEAVQGAIELAVRRHAEHRRLSEQVDQLEGALARRGTIERAKGILMERHGLAERAAFELLRGEARSSNRRVVELARAVTEGHALLPRAPD